MSEHRIHRYDLIKSKMIEEDPLSDVRAAVEQAFAIRSSSLDCRRRAASRSEHAASGTGPNPYFRLAVTCHFGRWKLGSFLNAHRDRGNVVLEPMTGVNNGENVPLLGRPWLAELIDPTQFCIGRSLTETVYYCSPILKSSFRKRSRK